MAFADRLPAFWQTFLWKWGGFILLDEKHGDFADLAAETGVPIGSIDAAMRVYDTLFPMGSGRSWFYGIPASEPKAKVLKMFPAQMKGLGANYRIWRSGKGDFEGFAGEAPYRRLIDWNNDLCKLLSE